MSYNVQCLAGHVGVAPEGSDLEYRCKRREIEHPKILDALIISWDECPECIKEYERRERKNREMLEGWE